METPEDKREGRQESSDRKPEDERSYEDNWYQVLRRRKEQEQDEDGEESASGEQDG
jgi:hypothetical protein